MMNIGILLAELNDQIKSVNANQEFLPDRLDELYAAKRTILRILERNGESEEFHIRSLDTKG